jgi:hypothetical protein
MPSQREPAASLPFWPPDVRPPFAQAKTEQTMRGIEVDKNGRRTIMWQAATANPMKETAN